MNNWARHPIDKIAGGAKSFVPIFQGNAGMSKKCEASLDNVAMFALDSTILLVSVRARYPMCNANALKQGVQLAILTTPVRLYTNNLFVKLSLNQGLKLMKNGEHISFAFDRIKPYKLTEIINKTNIIFETTRGCDRGSPYIGINELYFVAA
jgi:hypothetical protein